MTLPLKTSVIKPKLDGLGTISTQNANNVSITGGTIDGTALGTPTSGDLRNCTAATDDLRGVVELATTAEAIAGTATGVVMSPATALALIAASLPGTYNRDVKWIIKDYTGNDRRTLVTPERLVVEINNRGYVLDGQVELDLDLTANWDDTSVTNWATAANRAGKDFYIYACVPLTGSSPDVLLSNNSTYPTGYSASTSRKIGGFHCVCVSYGAITLASGTPHTLTGFLQGDIIPNSIWDLLFRAVSNNNVGQTFDPGTNRWVDIYLSSVSGGELVSVYGGTLATGASTIKFHSNKFKDWFNRVGKQMPTEGEFFSFSQQSNQGTVRNPASVPATTGGHVDSAGRRMVSVIGCEDCCGVLWQWGRDRSSNVGTLYADNWDTNDSADVSGQAYSPANVVALGGDATFTPAACGSRGSAWLIISMHLSADCGARGVTEVG